MSKAASMEEIDIHILVVPTMSWQSDLRISYSSACVEAVSAGFIRMLPSSILAEARTTARDQLDRYMLPPHFVFLRRLGRCLTQVSVKQEKLLQISSFRQKGASFIEIFVIDAASIGRSLNSIDGGDQRTSTLTRRGQEMKQGEGYDTRVIKPSRHYEKQWRGSEWHTEADYDQREWLHPTAEYPGFGQKQVRKTDPTRNWGYDNAAIGIKITYPTSGESDISLDSSSSTTSSSDYSQNEFDEKETLLYTADNTSSIHTLTGQSTLSNQQHNLSQQAPLVHNVKLTTDKPQSAPPATSSSTPDNIGRSTLADRDDVPSSEDSELTTQTDKNEPDTLAENNEQLQNLKSDAAQDEKEIAELLAQIQLVQEECDQLNTTKRLLEERQQQNRDNEQWRKKYHRERQKTTQLRSRLAVAKRQTAKEVPAIPSGHGTIVSTIGSSSEYANMTAQCERTEKEIKVLKERLHHTRHQLSLEQQARHSKLSERHQLQQELVSKKIAAGATRARQ